MTLSTMTPDCDLFNGYLSDDTVAAATDDSVMQNNCHGRVVQFFFCIIGASFALVAAILSIIFNYPESDSDTLLENKDAFSAHADYHVDEKNIGGSVFEEASMTSDKGKTSTSGWYSQGLLHLLNPLQFSCYYY